MTWICGILSHKYPRAICPTIRKSIMRVTRTETRLNVARTSDPLRGGRPNAEVYVGIYNDTGKYPNPFNAGSESSHPSKY